MTKFYARRLSLIAVGLLAGCGNDGTVTETSPRPTLAVETVAPDADVASPEAGRMPSAPAGEAVADELAGSPEATDATAANSHSLKEAIVGEWVDTENDERRIDFFENGSGVMLSDEGGFTATFYSFVDENTVRLAGGSGEMELDLQDDQLTIRFTRLGQPPFPYATDETAEFQRAAPAE